jgi:hypothetical protein
MRGFRLFGVVTLGIALTLSGCDKRPEQGVLDAAEAGPSGTETEIAPTLTIEPAAASAESTRILDVLARARALLAALQGLELTAEQELNVESAGSFTERAALALDEGDLERASVLSDKALTLLEAAVSETRSPPD